MANNVIDIAVFEVLRRQGKACTLKMPYTGFFSLTKLQVLILI